MKRLLTLLTLAVASLAAGAQTTGSPTACLTCPDTPAPQPKTSESMVAVPLGHEGNIELAPNDDHARAAIAPAPAARWHYLGEAFAPKAPGFFTVGSFDAPRPLRTARQTLASKSFLLLELGMYGAALADVNVNRNHRQNPPTPAHGELYIDAFAPLPVITFLHYLSDRYICRAIGVGAVGYVIGRHLYAVGRNVYP